jgi:hypothetical protein
MDGLRVVRRKRDLARDAAHLFAAGDDGLGEGHEDGARAGPGAKGRGVHDGGDGLDCRQQPDSRLPENSSLAAATAV